MVEAFLAIKRHSKLKNVIEKITIVSQKRESMREWKRIAGEIRDYREKVQAIQF